jgi:hypothetical protein
MEFNREKYSDLIMYVLYKSCHKPNFGKTVLCSILYFIDFNHYELYGELITNETYIKSKRGIRPLHFREISKDLISKKQLFFRKEPYYNRLIHKYYPLVIPNVKFSPEELEIINCALEKLGNENAHRITRYAIGDPPIMIAGLNEKIDFRYVFSRDEKYSILNNRFIY